VRASESMFVLGRTMSWELIAAGLGALTVVTIAAILLAAGGGGLWLVAFLPIAATAGGAVVLAGRD